MNNFQGFVTDSNGRYSKKILSESRKRTQPDEKVTRLVDEAAITIGGDAFLRDRRMIDIEVLDSDGPNQTNRQICGRFLETTVLCK